MINVIYAVEESLKNQKGGERTCKSKTSNKNNNLSGQAKRGKLGTRKSFGLPGFSHKHILLKPIPAGRSLSWSYIHLCILPFINSRNIYFAKTWECIGLSQKEIFVP
jgi:hypothetical protein